MNVQENYGNNGSCYRLALHGKQTVNKFFGPIMSLQDARKAQAMLRVQGHDVLVCNLNTLAERV